MKIMLSKYRMCDYHVNILKYVKDMQKFYFKAIIKYPNLQLFMSLISKHKLSTFEWYKPNSKSLYGRLSISMLNIQKYQNTTSLNSRFYFNAIMRKTRKTSKIKNILFILPSLSDSDLYSPLIVFLFDGFCLGSAIIIHNFLIFLFNSMQK